MDCSMYSIPSTRFDHHCPWVGNCIGEKNHHYFIFYLVFLSVLTLWTVWGCYVYLTHACPHEEEGYFPNLKAMAICAPWVKCSTGFENLNYVCYFSVDSLHNADVPIPLHLGVVPGRVPDLPSDIPRHDHQREDERIQIQTLSERYSRFEKTYTLVISSI